MNKQNGFEDSPVNISEHDSEMPTEEVTEKEKESQTSEHIEKKESNKTEEIEWLENAIETAEAKRSETTSGGGWDKLSEKLKGDLESLDSHNPKEWDEGDLAYAKHVFESLADGKDMNILKSMIAEAENIRKEELKNELEEKIVEINTFFRRNVARNNLEGIEELIESAEELLNRIENIDEESGQRFGDEAAGKIDVLANLKTKLEIEMARERINNHENGDPENLEDAVEILKSASQKVAEMYSQDIEELYEKIEALKLAERGETQTDRQRKISEQMTRENLDIGKLEEKIKELEKKRMMAGGSAAMLKSLEEYGELKGGRKDISLEGLKKSHLAVGNILKSAEILTMKMKKERETMSPGARRLENAYRENFVDGIMETGKKTELMVTGLDVNKLMEINKTESNEKKNKKLNEKILKEVLKLTGRERLFETIKASNPEYFRRTVSNKVVEFEVKWKSTFSQEKNDLVFQVNLGENKKVGFWKGFDPTLDKPIQIEITDKIAVEREAQAAAAARRESGRQQPPSERTEGLNAERIKKVYEFIAESFDKGNTNSILLQEIEQTTRQDNEKISGVYNENMADQEEFVKFRKKLSKKTGKIFEDIAIGDIRAQIKEYRRKKAEESIEPPKGEDQEEIHEETMQQEAREKQPTMGELLGKKKKLSELYISSLNEKGKKLLLNRINKNGKEDKETWFDMDLLTEDEKNMLAKSVKINMGNEGSDIDDIKNKLMEISMTADADKKIWIKKSAFDLMTGSKPEDEPKENNSKETKGTGKTGGENREEKGSKKNPEKGGNFFELSEEEKAMISAGSTKTAYVFATLFNGFNSDSGKKVRDIIEKRIKMDLSEYNGVRVGKTNEKSVFDITLVHETDESKNFALLIDFSRLKDNKLKINKKEKSQS